MDQDPIFVQLSQQDLVSGVFSMTPAGEVKSFCGDFADEMAEMYAPVILSLLMDVKGVLDTRPISGRQTKQRAPELMKRITIAYTSYSLVVCIVEGIVYVVKTTKVMQ